MRDRYYEVVSTQRPHPLKKKWGAHPLKFPSQGLDPKSLLQKCYLNFDLSDFVHSMYVVLLLLFLVVGGIAVSRMVA